MTPFDGELSVLGLDPFRQRHILMRDVCFIADVAVLPRWMRVDQVLAFTEGVHPGFRPRRARELLARTDIPMRAKVGQLSKGMVAQLHLSLAMAIDARLLVLDEPTLGLDILFRKEFYATLLNDYFDEKRTILVTTHQVEEIEHILTDLIFIDHGRVILSESMEAIGDRYLEIAVHPDAAAAARELQPIDERQVLGQPVFLFENVGKGDLARLGEPRAPSVSDLFVAKIRSQAA